MNISEAVGQTATRQSTCILCYNKEHAKVMLYRIDILNAKPIGEH